MLEIIRDKTKTKKKKKRKKKWKKKEDKSSKQKQPKEGEISSAEIRVGKILVAFKHENAQRLYVEEIDVGESEPRKICSGLVEHLQVSDLFDKKVLVFCNLKPKDAVGILSNGMVLCATDSISKKVELIKVPDNAKIGERVIFEGYEGDFEKQLNSKKLPKILKDLKTNGKGEVCFKDGKATLKSGVCFSNFINSTVS